MKSIFDTASNISTPLALAGITVIVLFFIYRTVLKKKIFSRQKEGNTFKIINRIITYLFVLALVSILLGVSGYLYNKYEKTNSSKNPSIPIEKMEPQFDSTLFKKTGSSLKTDLLEVQKASLFNYNNKDKSKGELSIVHVRDSTTGDLPVKFFTLMNRTSKSVIINKAAVDIIEYIPYASIPKTRKLRPIVIWDITLPYRSGYFEYKPQNPIIIEKDDAVNIGVRFSCDYYGKPISPSASTSYTFKFIFITDDEDIKAESSEITF